MTAKPTYQRTTLLDVGSISLGERSGWRPRSTRRIAELRVIFRAGQFGQSCACSVQVLETADVDGKQFIDDGFSTVAALQELKAEYEAMGAAAAPADAADAGDRAAGTSAFCTE